ncbi:MAG: Asp-tRNA(Asn)/Glu-tRNA(Gln) amidotransferase GatCAB subunit C [Gammaproteobacteria bacterium]|nr:MAG: Asp-tRNA(Asn)/Glu-tRNA(Gln) amidotransferase GatCAB subunit C [Pseudomonadota bacterium]PIE38908.1 MAG: Asp-tRNA(Asn)/Glu-tRNA(Gln) amidotransferase GatCAB subunit C [Gammaproteobacteria bacterium]
MSIDLSTVEKIAHLARLQVTGEQAEKLTRDLSNILDLVDQLQAADTTNVAPMAHPMDAVQVLREDIVTEQNQREELQRVAPETEDGLFLVPRVIE